MIIIKNLYKLITMVNFTSIGKNILKALCLAFVAVPMAVSCEKYDDTELRDKIEDLVNMIYNLEQKMNDEIKALKSMLEGKLLITEVEKSEDGVTTLKFSDGSTLPLFSKKDLKACVTYINDNGKYYWAYIDENGNKVAFLDKDGLSIPVDADKPVVIQKEDGKNYILIGGVEYPLTGNSVFSDYEVIADEYTEEVYAVTFTFGEGMKFTVTVDGASGFFFMLPGLSNTVIDNYYVDFGATQDVKILTKGVVDYVLQIPDGWRVKEREDSHMGDKFFSVTAPTTAMLETGVAAAEGDLKVVAVLEGGKATVAKLYLSTEPFKEFSVSLDGANVKKHNGLQKYVYGLCRASEFEEAAMLAAAEPLLKAYDYPKGYGVTEYDMTSMPLAEILGEELIPEANYTFWVLPVFYDDAKEDYYLKEGTFRKANTTFTAVDFEVADPKFRDATLSLTIDGSESYYAGMLLKEEFNVNDIPMQIANGAYELKSEKIYNGSVFTFFEKTAEPETEYVVWLVLAEDGKEYTTADVMVREFSTTGYVHNAESVKISASEVAATALELTSTLTAEGAETIYYAYVAANIAKRYDTTEKRFDYLLKNGKTAEAPEFVAKASEYGAKMAPEKKFVLFAAAVNAEGEYGDVVASECETTAIPHNDLQVKLAVTLNSPDKMEFSISTEGGQSTDYLYWIGPISDSFWKSTTYLGGTAESAFVYMYTNPQYDKFADAAENYPVVNGKITAEGFEIGKPHVLVAVAKDADGVYSYATELRFTPNMLNIGTIVMSTDSKYENARPTVTFLEDTFDASSGEFASYEYEVTVPVGYTAYVVSGSDNYVEKGGTTEEYIISIIDYVLYSRFDEDVTVDEELEKSKGYPYGHEIFSYEHGCPAAGEFIYWSSQEFHDSVCRLNDGEPCAGNYDRTDVFRDVYDHEGNLVEKVNLPWHNVININDGTTMRVKMPYGFIDKTKSVNRVFIVCQDSEFNCYEPFVFDVPYEPFAAE